MAETNKPVRVSQQDRVQVKATPVHNRYRDSAAAQSQPAISFSLSRPGTGEPPPSSNPSFIPNTAPRQSFRNALHNSASPAYDAIESTPARPPAADRIEATPVQRAAISATPIRQRARPEAPVDTMDAIPGSSPLMAKRAEPDVYVGGVRNMRELFRTPVKARPKAGEM
ncbi:hypothetical protein IMZ48_37510, partial [Candidatus Bathyarchaeota archaeon]|nr:hypothetical protein [Candidatus Bathyarchaeota archaeon]